MSNMATDIKERVVTQTFYDLTLTKDEFDALAKIVESDPRMESYVDVDMNPIPTIGTRTVSHKIPNLGHLDFEVHCDMLPQEAEAFGQLIEKFRAYLKKERISQWRLEELTHQN